MRRGHNQHGHRCREAGRKIEEKKPSTLAGIAAARIGEHLGWLKLLSGGIRPHALEKPLTFIGRHSLAF
ncbi:hypothetical protein H7D62_016485, partial [Brucella melitensis]|nr:hypothetical protein [Brucella melitensis]